MTSDRRSVASPFQTREGGPRLSDLEAQLGDFLVEEEISRTPRTVIYSVRAGKSIDRPLALKVALVPVDHEDLVRFQHEVRLLSEACHPNVIQVFDYGVLPGGYPFLTMELLSDEDLMRTVQEGDWEVLFDLAIQAAAGLAHIHRHGVVHLDVKPANLGLVRTETGGLRVKILDFGLAQSVQGPLDRRIRGTLAYTAPEVLLQDRYDHRADLYSLGVTLFQLATGVLPSAGDDASAIRFHLEDEPPDPQAYRSDMPGPLADILRHLLAKEPQGRYPSAGRLMLELARAADREIDPAELTLGEGRVLSSRMIGRDDLLDRLMDRLREVRAGESRVVVLTGPEGVGKSRLLRELRLAAAMGGARIGVGRSASGRPEPLRALSAALAGVGIELAGLQERVSSPPDSERVELFGKWGDRLREAAAAGGPLVLLLEGLELAGDEMGEWLSWLADQVDRGRILVVGALRVEDGEASASWLEAGRVERLDVPRLEPAQVRSLVDASLGAEELPAPLYDWIEERSQGLPGRIQQLLRHLIDRRILRFRQGEWKPSVSALSRLAAEVDPWRGLERERLATLDPEATAVLEALAVSGEPVPRHQVAQVLGREVEEVYALLDGLVEQGWVEPAPEDPSTFGLSRPDLADTILGNRPGDRLRQVHRAWATLLAGQHGEHGEGRDALAGAIGDHLWRAGAWDEAVPYLEEAARRALGLFAFRDAAELWGRVAEQAKEVADEEREIETLLAQADALEAAGSSFRALSLYRTLLNRLAGTCRRASDRVRLAGLWLCACRLYGRLGESEEQLSAAREGLKSLGDVDAPQLAVELRAREAEALLRGDQRDEAYAVARNALRDATSRGLARLRSMLLEILGRLSVLRGETRKALWLFERGLRAAEEIDDERLAARVRGGLARLQWQAGAWDEAGRSLEANLEVARRLRDPWGELQALDCLGTLGVDRGRWKEARDPLQRSLDFRRRLGSRDGEVAAWIRLGEVEEMLGDWPRAERHYRRGRRLAEERGSPAEGIAAMARLSSLARKRGDWSEAERFGRTALAASEKKGDPILLAVCHHQLGLTEKDREHWAPASAHLQRALELVPDDGGGESVTGQILSSLIDLSLRRGEASTARQLVERLSEWVETREHQFERAKLLSAEARLLIASGEPDEAETRFSAGVRLLEELEVPFEYARSLYEWGVRTRNPEVALERLDRALVAFERLGAATEFERTRGVMEGIRQRHQLASGGPMGAPGLWEIAKVINSSLDLQEVLDRIMDMVLERLKADRGMIVFANELTGELEIAASRNLGRDEEEGTQLSETVVRRVVESRDPVLSVDALTDPRFTGSESIVASHIVSILCVPLAIRDRPVGAIYVDHLESQRLFDPKDLEFLVAFSDQAAVAVENARLYGEVQDHRRRLKEENESLRREILSSRHLGSLIGKSRAIAQLKETLERVAASNSTVLVRGESGTGKGLVARILHSVSPRREGPFVHFNCAALPETLIESELFGHDKGAFTGAVGQKPGRFELAHGGTIFLDEIGKVSRAIQAKLLRVVEDREFERVGGTRTIRTDVRIVAATNLNLEEAITSGEFREDLYYRLNIIPIILPPLRERREDIPYLVEHFLVTITRDLGQQERPIDRAVLDLFLSYDWPGNVRELEAAVHRALVLSSGETLTRGDFSWIGAGDGSAAVTGPTAAALEEGNYGNLVDVYDRQLVSEALRLCDGKIRETARFLGIARNTLKAKLKRFELEA